jgi:hypothetical protein
MESFAYIPQLEVPNLGFPLLACNIDGIDVRLIGWKDPNRTDENEYHRYDSRNIIFDVAHEKLHRSRFGIIDQSCQSCDRKSDRPIFSVVKHYPPKWAVPGNSERELNQVMESMSYEIIEVEDISVFAADDEGQSRDDDVSDKKTKEVINLEGGCSHLPCFPGWYNGSEL